MDTNSNKAAEVTVQALTFGELSEGRTIIGGDGDVVMSVKVGDSYCEVKMSPEEAAEFAGYIWGKSIVARGIRRKSRNSEAKK